MTLELIILGVFALLQTALLAVLFLRKNDRGGETVTALNQQIDRLEKGLRDEMARGRADQATSSRDLREEVSQTMRDTSAKQIEVLNAITKTVDGKLMSLQESNITKLEEMRKTVDEKLQGTLDKRLGESFQSVREQLDKVHVGLGEMQTLATGVGDLKRVLTNVKTRGTWGEFQLRGILDQVMLPSQFEANATIHPGGKELVDFAVLLPGQGIGDNPVKLPIDSKFPKEDYDRILEAQDQGNIEAIKAARDGLARAMKVQAKKIKETYIAPPYSTDFAILFLPTESLFAEVCQYPGLLDTIQRDYRVTVAGPTTMATLLNSLRVGFQTLAIQKRSSEVWQVLATVKNEFGKFGELLESVEKKLDEAKNKISKARSKSKTLSNKLNKAEQIEPAEGTIALLPAADTMEDFEEDSTEDVAEEPV